jgi:single-strand DNA-binding protein
MSYMKLVIVGNLGRDPELRYLHSGQAVANLSVAANRRWTDQATGQPQEEVCWFRVSVWGRQAEAANQYLSKGRQVLIEGRLRPDPETGGPRIYARNDGTAGASFEVVADRVQFLGGNGNGDGRGNSAPGSGQAEAEPDYSAEDIPF